MIENMIYVLSNKTGMKYEDIMKLPASEVIDMLAKLK